MPIQLSDHFTTKKLIRFTLPSIAMMIFSSIYGVVDGFFISNYAGKVSFAAVNIIFPFYMILGTVGFMFGTGGSALVSMTMGKGDLPRARSIFSMLIYIAAAIGILLGTLGSVFIEPISRLLGAEGELLTGCITYGRILFAGLPAYILQMAFQSFCVTAEKPNLGLIITVAAGVTNILGDFLLVGVFPFGLAGAAVATVASQVVGGLVPVLCFALVRQGKLYLIGFKFDGWALLRTCTNGSSEFMSNISMSLVSIIYNFQLLKYAGDDGVAAYGVMMYVGMIFLAIFIGYSIGTAPVIGYHFGADNRDELQGILKRSLIILGIASVAMLVFAVSSAPLLSRLFVGYDDGLFRLTCRGFTIFSCAFLFSGYAIFGSGFFTALNDGFTSAAISFLRTLVFQIAAVYLLPLIFGIDGIWLSVVVAEFMAVVVSAVFLIAKRQKYGYLG